MRYALRSILVSLFEAVDRLYAFSVRFAACRDQRFRKSKLADTCLKTVFHKTRTGPAPTPLESQGTNF